MNKEIWKPIENYEGLYEVSNLGRVRSIDRIIIMKHRNGCNATHYYKGKILATRKNNSGYLKVDLIKDKKAKTFFVHRLVAIAFISNVENKPQVNHIDGNKENNTIENIEWCDAFENQQHALNIGLRKRRTMTIQEYQKEYYIKNKAKKKLQSKLNYIKRKKIKESESEK